MKTLMKTLIVLASCAMLFTGCAIKKTDSMETKIMKHTANSPLYAIGLVGEGVKRVAIGVVALPMMAAKALETKEESTAKEIK